MADLAIVPASMQLHLSIPVLYIGQVQCLIHTFLACIFLEGRKENKSPKLFTPEFLKCFPATWNVTADKLYKKSCSCFIGRQQWGANWPLHPFTDWCAGTMEAAATATSHVLGHCWSRMIRSGKKSVWTGKEDYFLLYHFQLSIRDFMV